MTTNEVFCPTVPVVSGLTISAWTLRTGSRRSNPVKIVLKSLFWLIEGLLVRSCLGKDNNISHSQQLSNLPMRCCTTSEPVRHEIHKIRHLFYRAFNYLSPYTLIGEPNPDHTPPFYRERSKEDRDEAKPIDKGLIGTYYEGEWRQATTSWSPGMKAYTYAVQLLPSISLCYSQIVPSALLTRKAPSRLRLTVAKPPVDDDLSHETRYSCKEIGRCFNPRMAGAPRHSNDSTDVVSLRCGKRVSSAVNAIFASNRASGAPKQ